LFLIFCVLYILISLADAQNYQGYVGFGRFDKFNNFVAGSGQHDFMQVRSFCLFYIFIFGWTK